MINELTSEISFTSFKEEVLQDYEIVCMSRAVSLLGRKEVLTGKAKFGIFGDGKELPQIAMAKAFQKEIFDLVTIVTVLCDGHQQSNSPIIIRWFVCTYRPSSEPMSLADRWAGTTIPI